MSSVFVGCGLKVVGTADGTAQETVEVRPAPMASGTLATPAPVTASGSVAPSGAGPAGSSGRSLCDSSDPALIACFDFEGVIADGSSHAQPVEVSGPTAYVAGIHGQALGVEELTRLHVPSGPAWTYGSLTVELRFRPAALPAAGARAGLLDKEGAFGVFLHSDGSVSCTMGVVISAGVATVQEWSHLACVSDGNAVVLYVDGMPKITATVGAPPPQTDQVVAVGGNSPDGEPFVGAIDDVRVLARALSPDEVASSARP